VTPTEVQLTEGLQQLSAEQIAAAFMGDEIAVEQDQDKEATEDGNEETETTEETEAAEESEAQEETESTEETETSEEPSDLDKGLLNALKDKPGLHKRVKALFVQNKELKAQLEAGTAQPLVLTPPQVTGQMFANARNETEIEAQAEATVTNARAKLRKLNRLLDGGTYRDGETETELSPEQVDAYIDHFEGLITKVDSEKGARKAYLKSYADTLKPLKDTAIDLVNPKVPHRESQLIRTVPEITRDPAYLQILADAKAGRELREKQATGVQFVEVKPGQKPAAGQKPTPGQKPAPAPKAGASSSRPVETPANQPLTADALQALRAKADAGDRQAQERLTEAFMNA
jgi:hypothetical protein